MLRRTVLALLALLVLAGCPDAVRGVAGDAPADEERDGAFDAPRPSEAADATDAAAEADAPRAPPRVGELVSSVSGNLVLTETDVLVATSASLVRIAKSSAVPTIASSIFAGGARAFGASDHLFVVHAVDAFTVTAADGSAPRVVRPGRLVDDAAGVVALGSQLFWSSTSGTRALHVTDASKQDGTLPIRDGDTERPVTHLASAGEDLVLATKHCLCAGGADATLFDLVRRRGIPDADDVPIGTVRALVGLVADARGLFVVERAQGVRAFSLDAAAARAEVGGDPALFDSGALALDATHVYWASRARGQVLRVRRDGSDAPEVFADGLLFPDEDLPYPAVTYDRGRGRIAVDERFVWVSDASRLLRFAK